MSTAGKRIGKELGEIEASPMTGIRVSLVDDGNLHNLNVVLDGPAKSPYAGGKFILLLVLPIEYPFKPPKLNFKTKIFHPNVTNDANGSMCLGILKGDTWKPSSKIAAVLQAAQQLLVEPNPEDAVETTAAEMFKNHRAQFDEQAKAWTKAYAT